MACLLVLMLAMAACGQEFEGHARHWRNYLNGLLAQLAQESPKPDLRHELWKQLLSGRVRSFLVGEDESMAGSVNFDVDDNYGDQYYGDELPLQVENAVLNSGRLSDTWREHVADALLARPALVQRNRHTTTAAQPVEVFSPYRHTARRSTTKAPNGSSSESPNMLRFLDILNSHSARHVGVDSPQPPLLCRCSPGKNGSGNGSSDVVMGELMTTSTTTSTTASRQPPLLLVVPGLMVAPRDGHFAVLLDNKTLKAGDLGTKLEANATSTSAPMPTVKLRRRRLRFVLVLVAFVVALSASLAYYMRLYLAKYNREYEIIRNAQFL